MTEHADDLREAFQTHEQHTPDPAAVYARVEELAQKYRRRRLGAQIGGGAVLGAGLIAAALTVPGLVPQHQEQNATMVAPAAAPVGSASPAAAELSQTALDAYFDAGYDYSDAQRLAILWKMDGGQIGAVKAEAGRRLLAGQTLPFPATPVATPTGDPTISADDQDRYDVYFKVGYDWDDAVKLAKLWNLDDPSKAKLKAGERLLAGQPLPFQPTPGTVVSPTEAKRVNAFFKAGYDYDDAAKLAKRWKLATPYDAKIEGGKRLLAGQTLPIKP